MARYCLERGMAGYVLKSHLWPTMDRAYHLRQQVPELLVVPGIALNLTTGGVAPGIVETALKQGAGVIWMPTWSSAHDLARNGFSRLIRAELPGLIPEGYAGIRLIDDDGKLKPEVRDVVRLAADADVVLSSGHISPEETLAIAREADRIGFRKFIFSHPDSHSVSASDEYVLEAARLGAFIEWTFNGMLPIAQRITPAKVAEWIERLGPERCVLTTDTFGRASLPMADLFMYYMTLLSDAGVSDENLALMTKTTPAALLAR